jgi:ribosomal protein L9
LDKRKINSADNITALGTYDIPIQLHKEVVATIRLYVVEKE